MPTEWHLLAFQTHETKAEGGRRILGSGPLGCNCVRRLLLTRLCPIGVLGIASERYQLYALLVGSQNVDPEDEACAEPQVGHGPLYGPLPGLLFVGVCLGGPDPDTRDPACCRVRVPGDKYRPLWLVGQDKTPVEAHGQVLPLLGGRLGHKQALFLWQI